jgi:hypothetical protein
MKKEKAKWEEMRDNEIERLGYLTVLSENKNKRKQVFRP